MLYVDATQVRKPRHVSRDASRARASDGDMDITYTPLARAPPHPAPSPLKSPRAEYYWLICITQNKLIKTKKQCRDDWDSDKTDASP